MPIRANRKLSKNGEEVLTKAKELLREHGFDPIPAVVTELVYELKNVTERLDVYEGVIDYVHQLREERVDGRK